MYSTRASITQSSISAAVRAHPLTKTYWHYERSQHLPYTCLQQQSCDFAYRVLDDGNIPPFRVVCTFSTCVLCETPVIRRIQFRIARLTSFASLYGISEVQHDALLCLLGPYIQARKPHNWGNPPHFGCAPRLDHTRLMFSRRVRDGGTRVKRHQKQSERSPTHHSHEVGFMSALGVWDTRNRNPFLA